MTGGETSPESSGGHQTPPRDGGSSPAESRSSRGLTDDELTARFGELESRITSIESTVDYSGDGYADKFHHLQSLITDVRSVVDALVDAEPGHDRGERVALATTHRETLLDTSVELEQVTAALEELQGQFRSSSKFGKFQRLLEFADGKRGRADAVALPSDDIYGVLNDTSDRRCRQLMDEFASSLSYCETDHRRRSDGKEQKRLKIDFSRHSLEEMVDQAGRVL